MERENGKESLPTTQAMYLLFIYCTTAAKDRLGLMYRYSACEMYKRMKSGTKIPTEIPTEDTANHMQLVSRHAWGLFYLETFFFPPVVVYVTSLTSEQPNLFCVSPATADQGPYDTVKPRWQLSFNIN